MDNQTKTDKIKVQLVYAGGIEACFRYIKSKYPPEELTEMYLKRKKPARFFE